MSQDCVAVVCQNCGADADYPDCDKCGAELVDPLDSSERKRLPGTAESSLLKLKPVPPLENPPKEPPAPVIERPCFMTHDDWFMSQGQRLRPGLYWHTGSKSPEPGDDPPKDIWVCSPIYAEAITADENDASYGRLLRFINTLGRWREWAMPMQMLKGSGEELRGELLNLGVEIDPKNRNLLNNWLMSRHPERKVVAATRTGWHNVSSGVAFVLPGQTIGADNVRFQSEHATHDAYNKRGTLEGWREQVAGPCSGNTILTLAVSIAFTGPLLKLAKLQEVGGAGVHLVGDSSRGKTTALQAAASVWGGPGFVRTWRATGNGLEATAAAQNDTLLVLDEISECDPREIGSIVYALANGQGKQRAQRTGSARESARWRIMALSSGERTLSAHMNEAGKKAKAGQEARLLDIPATTRTYGAFDTLHDCENGRAFADRIKLATAANFGYAGTAFVTSLVNDSQDFPKLYASICRMPGFTGGDGVESRAAGTFALISMAGELATEYGITGWREGDALDAALEGFALWKEARGEGQTEDRQILNAVSEFIAKHGDSRFSSIIDDGVMIRERAGYWRKRTLGQRREFLFFPYALTEAATGFDQRRVIAALDSAGWIVDHDNGKRSKGIKLNGANTRFYVVMPNMEGGS